MLSGSATVTGWPGTSGGRLVQNLGTWGPGMKKQGALTFTGVTVPADGKYTVILYSVDTDSEPTRTAVITVPGAATVTVTVVSGSTCCSAKAVELSLRKGENTITISGTERRAPSMDRIVVNIP